MNLSAGNNENKSEKIPEHIAFIIDGNGRWANKRGLARTMGHKKGVEAVKETIENCLEKGIKVVSFYCFSTENWSRPKEEVDEIFRLFNNFFKQHRYDFMQKDIKLVHSGDLNGLDTQTRKNILVLEEETATNSKMICNICINYGARQEIVKAVNELLKEKRSEITIKDISDHLYTKGIPDPDLIVRTSGEQRLSNFMLFQSAYSEFYFTGTYWPDFDKKELEEAISSYNSRNRRYGKI